MRRRLRRARQLADLFVLAWIVLWVWLATWLHDLVMLLAGPVEVWRTPAAAWQTTSTAPVMGLATCRSSGTLWRPRWKARRIRGGPDRPGGAPRRRSSAPLRWGSRWRSPRYRSWWCCSSGSPCGCGSLSRPVRCRIAAISSCSPCAPAEPSPAGAGPHFPQPSSALRGNSAALAALAALEMRAVGLRPTVPTAPPQPP